MANVHDYVGAGFRVFGLYGATNGKCDCGDLECKALYKHPRVSNWQFTPDWTDDQLELMEMTGQFSTGFGVLCEDWLVVDVDPRGGGDESLIELNKAVGVDLLQHANYVVRTGGGGWHIYYTGGHGKLRYKHSDYPGIEFKTTGYVVGDGSIHASGNHYETERGHPDAIGAPPPELVELLRRPEMQLSASNDHPDKSQLATLLEHIPNTDATDYDDWIAVGMALHHATEGDGFDLWMQWSAKGPKHDPAQMDYKWHSFGKSADVVTVGTLRKMAEDNGYQEPVTFEYVDDEPEHKTSAGPVDASSVDLTTAPGLVGRVIHWIDSQCLFPRRALAVAAALVAVGNIGGMRHRDRKYRVVANIIAFCVAGSSTGKEAVQQAQRELQAAAGFVPCTYGKIKSEQEIYRNLIDHQSNSYIIDEFGLMLAKIEKARQRGSTAYLDGILAAIMSAYSKSDGRLLLGGDEFKTLTGELKKELALLKEAEAQGNDVSARIEQTQSLLDDLYTGGLREPFLSITGYTTPVTFNDLVTYEIAANGFIGRAILFEERETNPVARLDFTKPDLPASLRMELLQLAWGGTFDAWDGSSRIEWRGDHAEITTTPEAAALLAQVASHLHDLAEYHKEQTGLEAVVRRGYEHILKISMILAMGDGGERTPDHVKWAYALIRRDIDDKTRLASGNIAAAHRDRHGEIISKVMHCVSKEGVSEAVIANRHRKFKREDIRACLEYLVSKGDVVQEEVTPARGPKTMLYKLP